MRIFAEKRLASCEPMAMPPMKKMINTSDWAYAAWSGKSFR